MHEMFKGGVIGVCSPTLSLIISAVISFLVMKNFSQRTEGVTVKRIVLLIAFVFFLEMVAEATGASREVVLLETSPTYGSLEEARTGNFSTQIHTAKRVGQFSTFEVRSERDGWIDIATGSNPKEWLESSHTVPLERFLKDPEFYQYTTCAEELPRIFAVPLGSGGQMGTLRLVPRPNLKGGEAVMEILDASGKKLWGSSPSKRMSRRAGSLYAECRGSALPGGGNWVRAAGDLDGDGRMEILMGGDAEHGISSADFTLYRWDGEKPVPVRSFSLQEPDGSTAWRTKEGGGTQQALDARRLVFARADTRQQKDGSIVFPMANWKDRATGMARMRLAPSGEHFILEKWDVPMGGSSTK